MPSISANCSWDLIVYPSCLTIKGRVTYDVRPLKLPSFRSANSTTEGPWKLFCLWVVRWQIYGNKWWKLFLRNKQLKLKLYKHSEIWFVLNLLTYYFTSRYTCFTGRSSIIINIICVTYEMNMYKKYLYEILIRMGYNLGIWNGKTIKLCLRRVWQTQNLVNFTFIPRENN